MSVLRTLVTLFILTPMLTWGAESPEKCGTKTVIGPTVFVRVKEPDILYLAKVDAESDTVSLRAWNLVIDNPAKKPEDNIGKIVRFRTSNEKGEEATARARIVDRVKVNDANGSVQRYVVELTITYAGQQKVVHANLSERGRMTYPLLLGRNWLSGNFVIDVDLPEYKP